MRGSFPASARGPEPPGLQLIRARHWDDSHLCGPGCRRHVRRQRRSQRHRGQPSRLCQWPRLRQLERCLRRTHQRHPRFCRYLGASGFYGSGTDTGGYDFATLTSSSLGMNVIPLPSTSYITNPPPPARPATSGSPRPALIPLPASNSMRCSWTGRDLGWPGSGHRPKTSTLTLIAGNLIMDANSVLNIGYLDPQGVGNQINEMLMAVSPQATGTAAAVVNSVIVNSVTDDSQLAQISLNKDRRRDAGLDGRQRVLRGPLHRRGRLEHPEQLRPGSPRELCLDRAQRRVADPGLQLHRLAEHSQRGDRLGLHGDRKPVGPGLRQRRDKYFWIFNQLFLLHL